MIRVLSAKQISACDRAAIEEYRIPGLVLMENAGVQVVEAMTEWCDGDLPARVAILCGKGNNGGDGLVVARHLHDSGVQVSVWLLAAAGDLKEDPATNLGIAEAAGLRIEQVVDDAGWVALTAELQATDCIVDALLGTGLHRAARGEIAEAIEAINRSTIPVVAVDVPSGVSADTSNLLGATVEADLTVTFAAPKVCHVMGPTDIYCGEVVVADIGIPRRVMESAPASLQLLTASDALALLPVRAMESHKGDCGRVLVVAGSVGTTGAAALTAEGACRGGAGLVTVATPEPVYPIVAAKLTEPLVVPLPVMECGGLGDAAVDRVLEMTVNADVLAIGPGLGTDASTVAAIRSVLDQTGVPIVVDADGLNAFAGEPQLIASEVARVLTPHPGEMARLLGSSVAKVQADRVAAAERLAAEADAIVVLKGYRTVISGSDLPVVNSTGNAGMATGGSGDVLTGMIAALIGQGLPPADAACLAVFLHGLAGDLAADEFGELSLVAGDLLDCLPAAIEILCDRNEDDPESRSHGSGPDGLV